jgi:clan AA aspartic protease (TIGR02281 family)
MATIVKHLYKIGALVAIFSFFSPVVVKAQEQQGCFMLGADNNPISLGSLCSYNNSSNINSNKKATNGVFEIPIKRRKNGIPIIDVKFNDGHTFEMMLDTGATVITVTPEIAETLGLKIEDIVSVSTPSDAEVKMPLSKVKVVSVGGMTANNLETIIAESLDMGLLGQNFFEGYDVTIKRDSIEFRRHD